jgi:hypothetical protein
MIPLEHARRGGANFFRSLELSGRHAIGKGSDPKKR